MFRLDQALQERTRLTHEMKTLLDTVQAESRDLGRREKAKLDDLESQIRKLDWQIAEANAGRNPLKNERADGGQFAAARARATAFDSATRGEAVGLTRGQSMQEWAEQRNGFYGVAGDGIESGDVAEMNLGSIVRAMVTGRRDGMTDVEKRALSEGTDSAGGYLTPEILSSRLIDRVRNVGRIFQAGATVVPLESDTVNLARLVSGVSPSWKTEGNAVGVSDMTFDRLTFKPKTLPVLVKLSQELFDDMSQEAHALIEGEIAKAIALEVDRAALYGSGIDPEPLGIKGQSGVTLTAFGGANGAAPTNYDWALDGIQTLRGGNFEPDGIIVAPRTVRTLDGLKDSQGRYLDPPPSYKAVPVYSTNQIPANLTVDTSNDCSDAFVGAWSNLLVGFRPSVGLRVKVLGERFADTMQVGILAWVRADVQLAHAAAFNVISGIKP